MRLGYHSLPASSKAPLVVVWAKTCSLGAYACQAKGRATNTGNRGWQGSSVQLLLHPSENKIGGQELARMACMVCCWVFVRPAGAANTLGA